MRMKLIAALACCFALGLPLTAFGQQAGQEGAVWNLGQQRAGAVYQTTIAATNECSGRRDFAIELQGQALVYLKPASSDRIDDVRRGESKAADYSIDLRGVAPGAYYDGRVLVRCLNCPPTCRQDVKTLEVRLVVLPEAETTTQASEPTTAPGETQTPAQPGERTTAAGRQPGERTIAKPAGRSCVQYPRDLNITSWDIMADLDRNGAMGREPGAPRDYLNSIREDLQNKIYKLQAMDRDITRVIDAYGGLEKYGVKCEERNAGEPSFPPFPNEDFFVNVDLCQAEGDMRLVDLVDPNADPAALEAWYNDFLRAFNNFGLEGRYDGTSLFDQYGAELQASIAKLNDAAKLFQERMEVSMALRFNGSEGWNRFVDGMVTVAGVAISAATAGGGTLAWAAAMGAGLQSFGLNEATRAASGGDPLAMTGAQIIGSIISLGTGTASGIGEGFATALQGELVQGVGLDAASNVISDAMKAQARNIALSMAVLDDDVWNRQIAYLRDDVGYRADGIAQFQSHRQKLKEDVAAELAKLCAMRKTLRRIMGPLTAARQLAVERLETQSWRDPFQEKELGCYCCRYSDGSGPDRDCRFTIPAF